MIKIFKYYNLSNQLKTFTHSKAIPQPQTSKPALQNVQMDQFANQFLELHWIVLWYIDAQELFGQSCQCNVKLPRHACNNLHFCNTKMKDWLSKTEKNQEDRNSISFFFFPFPNIIDFDSRRYKLYKVIRKEYCFND